MDSLEAILKNSPSDSIRFITLIKLSQENQYKDLTKASAYSGQALALAEKKQWVWGKSKAYGQESFLATISGDYATAMKYDNQNLQLVIAQKDSLSIAETLGFLGNDYKDLGKYDEAYYYFTQSFKVARAIPDSLKMAIAIHNIGTVLSDLGQYDLALDHFKISSKISLAINDLDGIAYDLDAMGDVYRRKKEYNKAEEYLLKALKSIRERKLTVIEPRALTHIAHLYFIMSDLPKSLAYYDTASRVYGRTSNTFGEAEVNLGISEVFIEQGKFDQAQVLIEKSLKTAQGLSAERMEIDCYQKLSNLAERKGDFKSALIFHKNFKVMEDSLFSQEMLEKVFQDQLRFQTENKDSEIANLSKVTFEQDSELRRQEFLSNILVVVVALTAILLFTVYRSGQRRKRINKLLIEHQEEIKRRSIELEQLNQVKDKFFSIISHDLRSPINALSGILELLSNKQITQEEFATLTQEMRVQFNHTRTLINNLLDWALLQMDKLKIQPEKIELSKVINENFTLVQSLQLKEMNLVNQVEPGLFGWGDLNMINLIFRNLILNAIKFSDIGGAIEISANQDGNFYVLAVKDYGVGISPDVQKILFDKTTGYSTRGTANEKGTGLGLILCKEFIEKNGGQIWLESEEGKGSTFYFTIKKA
ncbi:MAG: tetratricopeptide repeat-containing sensor histidine kinase [Cyclobacteriaceae bacterium]|nr:tetratricopeptide repeat-containing sensor histidine kinase [Cyclobacteriaceae bacterium]